MTFKPYNKAVAITKSDTDNFPAVDGPCEAIHVGGAGVVVVVFENDSTASFTCVAGQVLEVRAKRVNSSSTTATLMVALYRV